jgi:hypothetical protein
VSEPDNVLYSRLINNTYVENGFTEDGVNEITVRGGALFIESPFVDEGDEHMLSLVGNSCIANNAGPSVLSEEGNGQLFWYLSHTLLGDVNDVGDLYDFVGFIDSHKDEVWEEEVELTEDFQLPFGCMMLDHGSTTASFLEAEPAIEMDMRPFGEDLDFDLTVPDAGWVRRIGDPQDPQVLSQSVVHGGILNAGFYSLTGASLSLDVAEIKPGAIIRVGDNAVLELLPSTGQLQIGAEDSVRTAIVGRNAELDPLALRVQIGKFNSAGSLEGIGLNGILFNYAPDQEVAFNNLDVDFGSESVQLMNCIGGRFQFNNCIGNVSGFEFENNGGSIQDPDFGLGQVGLFGSSMNIRGNQFGPVSSENDWALKLHGTRAGASIHVADNLFDGSNQSNFPVRLDKSAGLLYGNYFQNLHHGAVTHTLSTGHYYRGAMNTFVGSNDLEPVNSSILLSESGEVDLYCGYNTFIRPDNWVAIHKMVEYINQVPNLFANWTHNYWAKEVDESYSLAELTGAELVPSGIDLGELLAYSPTFPWQYYPCNEDPLAPGQLLSQGLEAEALEDFETAVSSYFPILAEYPDSKEANEAIIRLKAIGLYTSFGEENYLDLRGSFAVVIPIMHVVDSHLAVFEQCVDLLLFGRYEDHFAAKQALEDLLAQTTDPTDIKCIDLALLELATLPIPGQTSSVHGVDRSIELQQTVAALMDYNGGSSKLGDRSNEIGSLPQTFAITSCYPNPFNPVCTVKLDVPVSSNTTVALYNMRGQHVAQIVSGELDAGRHEFTIDGSSLASGVYIVRAESEHATSLQKVMLLK